MTDSAWCAKKNDGAGHAVSAKLDEFNAWQCDAQRQIRSERIPGVTVEMPAEVLREVLSPEECQSLIEGIPKGGAGHMDGAEVSQLYRDRVLASRYLSHDPKLALQVMDRISAYLPGGLDGGRLFRVSPTFRFLHYEEGGRQGCHIDGREPAEPVLEEAAGGWVQSRLTLQMYLNSHGVDFEGGELVFLQPGNFGAGAPQFRAKHIYEPCAGDALVFYQERLQPPSNLSYELHHEASDVEGGNKYACRTMIEYVFPDRESATMGNIKDDASSGRIRRYCPERPGHASDLRDATDTTAVTLYNHDSQAEQQYPSLSSSLWR